MTNRMISLFFTQSPNLVPLLFTITVIVASFAVGAVAYRWIEQPSDSIGKRITCRHLT